MKVLHLSSHADGEGAARGSRLLHEALRDAGIDSQMLVIAGTRLDKHIHLLPPPWINRQLSAVAHRLRPSLLGARGENADAIFSTYLPPRVPQRDLLRAIDRIKPDVIHLHWVADGFVTTGTLARFNRPVVWTLRDLLPITGGCHYTFEGCDRFRHACRPCPAFRDPLRARLPGWAMARKQRIWRDVPIQLVAMSEWVLQQTARSALFHDAPITLIPNAIDTTRFAPLQQREARRRLGLPLDGSIVLFGAIHGTADGRKGFQFVRRGIAAGRWPQANARGPARLVTFGRRSTQGSVDHVHNCPRIDLGHLDDDALLRCAYAAADLTLMPSTVETFGKVAAESMACGTPVLTFDTSGLRDIVEHGVTGFRARCFDIAELFGYLDLLLRDDTRRLAFGRAARERAQRLFGPGDMARRHIALYDRVIFGAR